MTTPNMDVQVGLEDQRGHPGIGLGPGSRATHGRYPRPAAAEALPLAPLPDEPVDPEVTRAAFNRGDGVGGHMALACDMHDHLQIVQLGQGVLGQERRKDARDRAPKERIIALMAVPTGPTRPPSLAAPSFPHHSRPTPEALPAAQPRRPHRRPGPVRARQR